MSGKAHVDRTCRIAILFTIFLCDVFGSALSVCMIAQRPAALTELILVSIAVVVVSELLGLYQVGCLPVLRRTISATVGCHAVLVLAVFAVTLYLFGPRAAVTVAGALACGSAFALVGRFTWLLLIRTYPTQFIGQSILIGMRVAFDQASWIGITDFTELVVLSEVDFEQPQGMTRPTIGRSGMLTRLGRIDQITIVKAGFTDSQLRRLLLELDAMSSPITVLSDLSGGHEALLAPGDAWLVRSSAMRSRTLLIKRAFDICASVTALMAFFPLLLVVSVAIRVETRGPVLFRQQRHGRDGRPFTVLKFRTMRSDGASADGSVQAVRGDARVTRVGAFLRTTSIDELPQLLNVLTGSMSLVGPRPHPVALDQRFVTLIERYSARQRVVPGMTGWAQINGFRGETKSIEQMRRRVELDLEYIRDHSIAFDLLILFRTATSLLAHRNAAY